MFDFPNNPSDGDVVNHPNGRDYQWNGSAWTIVQDDLATLTARVAALESILQNQLILE
tara:strand:- start:121 stop:294 length:174 start_codon:yes stop_codon:yes gene_type:complete